MRKLARVAVAHPRTVLAAWTVAIAALAFAGLGVEDRLHRTALVVDGTPSQKAIDVYADRFGENINLAVMVEGPAGELERRGPALATELDSIPRATALSPWMPGAAPELRPSRARALILLRGDGAFEDVSRELVPRAREVLADVPPPLRAHMTGAPDVAAGVHGDTIEALRRAELIAAPVLLIVLLFVFRSPVAAAIPLALGLTTVAAGRGAMSLVNELQPLDAAGLNLASMMGLALGVDYSLLLVSRFREELAAGADARGAASIAAATAGRTVVFAGLALALAMGVAAAVAPGDLLASGSIGATVAAVISVLGGVTAVPAALTLLGPRVNKWSFGRPGTDSVFSGWALRALRRPALAGALVLALVLAMALPAAAIETGPPDPRVLPASSPERSDYEAISSALGPGWSNPYEIVVEAPTGTVTDPRRLELLAEWQRRLTALPGVSAVYGPAALARGGERIRRAAGQLERAGQVLERGRRDGARLLAGLERADGGVAQLRTGLAEAASAAEALETGAASGEEGGERLRDGLERAAAGAERLRSGLGSGRDGLAEIAGSLGRAREGTERLQAGLVEARAGAEAGSAGLATLADGLGDGASELERLREPAQIAESELERARAALDQMLPTSKADPAYARAYEAVARASAAASGRNPLTGQPIEPGYDGFDAGIASAVTGIRQAEAAVRAATAAGTELAGGLARLETGIGDLRHGLDRLDDGADRLLDGLARLDSSGEELAGGLTELESGSASLEDGLGRLRSGSGRLASGLDRGHERSGALASGLDRLRYGAQVSVRRTERLDGGAADPGELAGPLRSGYFLLAAIDGGDPAQRSGSSFAVNVDRGGDAARVSVIASDDAKRTGHPLRERLEDESDRFAEESGMNVQVGGAAAVLQDFNGAAWGRMWVLVLLLCGITWLVLIPVLRSLLLPLLAVVLNVFTVGAAFGVLALLFQGSAPLGGPGFLDAIMVAGIFSVVFGLSIDYEVFLLARMREGWVLTGRTDAAVEHGLRKTAGVVTGAAMILLGVFVVFSFAEITIMRQLGIGLSVAIALDATLIRLVLLPAAIRLCGERCWTLPRWIERRLPPEAPAPA
jgi:RND superfamily putative drug exporter